MTKIRIEDALKDDDSVAANFMKLSRVKRPTTPKAERASSSKLASLEVSNAHLSKSVLALNTLLRQIITVWVPDHLQAEYNGLRELAMSKENES